MLIRALPFPGIHAKSFFYRTLRFFFRWLNGVRRRRRLVAGNGRKIVEADVFAAAVAAVVVVVKFFSPFQKKKIFCQPSKGSFRRTDVRQNDARQSDAQPSV